MTIREFSSFVCKKLKKVYFFGFLVIRNIFHPNDLFTQFQYAAGSRLN